MIDLGADIIGDLLQILTQLKLDHCGRDALDHRRADILDIGQASDRILDRAGYLVFNLRRCSPALNHRNGDRWKADIRILFDRQQAIGEGAGYGQGGKNDRDRDRILDRPGRYAKLCHYFALVVAAA